MNKILSIIIPTYNAQKFLDKGLTSFIMDDDTLMKELEVIVVNDGTPDNSVAVAQKYVDRYPDTFRILNKENGGHGSAINAGVKAASGKYFQVVDADDWVDTKVLATIMHMLGETEADAMIHAHQTHNVTTKEIEHKHVKCQDESRMYNLSQMMGFWDDIYWGLTFHGVLYNTKFYKNLNYELIEGVFYEDQEYSTVPLCFASKIKIADEELYMYRIGDVNQSVSTQSLIKRLPDLETVIYRLADAKKLEADFAEGGSEYWLRKLTKCVADYYHIALIVNPDKKAGRKRVAAFNQKLVDKYNWLYEMSATKYKVFKLYNALHIGERGYQFTIGNITELRSKLRMKKNRQ